MTINASAGTSPPAPQEPTNQEPEASDQGPRANRPTRRTFTAEFKRSMVREYDTAPIGSKGAVLRRERLYDSHITEWRTAIEAGTLEKRPARPGRPKKSLEQAKFDQLVKELAAERNAHARTRDELATTEAALNTLGKGVAFLDALSSKNASFPAPNTTPGKQKPSQH